MTYKTILVQLDDMPDNEQRLQYAIRLSELFDAELTGLYLQNMDALPAPIAPVDNTSDLLTVSATIERIVAEQLTIQQKQYEARCNRAQEKFDQHIQQYSCKARFKTTHGDERQQLSHFARYHDLTISSQYDSDHPLNNCSKLAADVAVHSGHPVILLPEQQTAAQTDWSPDKALIAWSNTPESARAVCNALPLLCHSQQVSIFVQQGTFGQTDSSHEEGQRLCHYLAQHKIDAALISDTPTNTGEELLSCAQQSEQDLIVMAAYGHSKLHELLLGSTSRFVLNNTTLPVLISH